MENEHHQKHNSKIANYDKISSTSEKMRLIQNIHVFKHLEHLKHIPRYGGSKLRLASKYQHEYVPVSDVPFSGTSPKEGECVSETETERERDCVCERGEREGKERVTNQNLWVQIQIFETPSASKIQNSLYREFHLCYENTNNANRWFLFLVIANLERHPWVHAIFCEAGEVFGGGTADYARHGVCDECVTAIKKFWWLNSSHEYYGHASNVLHTRMNHVVWTSNLEWEELKLGTPVSRINDKKHNTVKT